MVRECPDLDQWRILYDVYFTKVSGGFFLKLLLTVKLILDVQILGHRPQKRLGMGRRRIQARRGCEQR